MILRIPALHSLSQIKKADHPVKIEIDANDSNGQLVELLNCIRHKGNVGHSFVIIVDPEIRESTERFSWDGDGSDRIEEIKVNGEVLKYTKDRLGRCHDEKGHLIPCSGGSSAAGAKTKTPGAKPAAKPREMPAAGLSREDRATIEHYKRTGYAKMNAHLRRGDKAHMLPDERKQAQKNISKLEKIIENNPLPKDTRVFRGIGDPEIFKNFDRLQGAIISDAGFVSTSESVDIAAQHARSANLGIRGQKPKRGIIAVINLPKGSKAISLGADDSEKEVILQRASKFKVTSTDRSGPYWRIDLEAVT